MIKKPNEKLCDLCKHFLWVPNPFTAYEKGMPTCGHKNGWKGVDMECIGVPLRVDWARSNGASCGPDGKNFEKLERAT